MGTRLNQRLKRPGYVEARLCGRFKELRADVLGTGGTLVRCDLSHVFSAVRFVSHQNDWYLLPVELINELGMPPWNRLEGVLVGHLVHQHGSLCVKNIMGEGGERARGGGGGVGVGGGGARFK